MLGTAVAACGVVRVRASAAAMASSRAVPKRRAGSLAIAVAITSSSCVGNRGTKSVTFGGAACRCAIIIAAIPLAVEKGVFPVSIRNSAQPSEYTSARPSNGSPARTSGAA